MSHIRLFMPNGGNDGVIIAINELDYRVEFRGNPYHLWDIEEDTPMFHLHNALSTVNISQFQNDMVETVTPWNKEWEIVKRMFDLALTGELITEATVTELPFMVVFDRNYYPSARRFATRQEAQDVVDEIIRDDYERDGDCDAGVYIVEVQQHIKIKTYY